MARYMPIALSAARNVGKHTPRTLYRNIAFTLESGEVVNLSPLWRSFESERVFSTLPTFQQCHVPSASVVNSICPLQRNDQREQEWIQFYSSCPNMINYQSQRMFSTSACNPGRSKKGPFERSNAQTFLDASRDLKRKGSSIGQFKSNMDSDFIRNKKNQLKETKLKINRRFGKIRSSFQIHNKKISETLLDQHAKRVAKRLKGRLIVKRENIKTIPNLLTTLRMASAPLLSYLVVSEYYGCALTIFVLAGLSDVLDGYIARNFKDQATAFGTALDPLADKLLISFLTISLTSCGLIPVPLTVLIIGRDAGLVFASFFIRYYSLAPPRTLSRYFDFSHVTAKVYPSNISKINTGVQLSYVACALAAPVFDFVESPWLQLLMYTTAATTFLSGADYVLTWQRRLKFIKNN